MPRPEHLSEVFKSLEVQAARALLLQGASPWALQLARPATGLILVGIEGAASLELGAGQRVVLDAGTRVLLTSATHRLSEGEAGLESTLEPAAFTEPFQQKSLGSGPPTAKILLLAFELEGGPDSLLARSLPPMLVAPGDPKSGLGAALAAWLQAEVALAVGGSDVIVGRLTEGMLVSLIRTTMARGTSPREGLVSALSEPQIGAAIGLVHDAPHEDWTVAALASRVGMSRSAFAARFTQLVGEAPLHYVTRRRMQVAAQLLRGTSLTLLQVSQRVGYDSEAAFSKAFKRWSGRSPGTYRRGGAKDAGPASETRRVGEESA